MEEEVGASHSMIICDIESFPIIQDIRRKFNKELPASFILIGFFINISSLVFGNLQITRRLEK